MKMKPIRIEYPLLHILFNILEIEILLTFNININIMNRFLDIINILFNLFIIFLIHLVFNFMLFNNNCSLLFNINILSISYRIKVKKPYKFTFFRISFNFIFNILYYKNYFTNNKANCK
jgi:hypothetical protein